MGLEEIVRRGYRVSGRVQGVGYRWFTTTAARELGLRGSVKNLADGAVEVVVEGPPDAVETLARRLSQGPPAARVEAVREVEPSLPVPAAGFEVVR